MRYSIDIDDKTVIIGLTPWVPLDGDIVVTADDHVYRVMRRQFYINTDGDIERVKLFCEDFDERCKND